MNANLAPAPSRATASGTLAWGLVVIPIQFFAGIEDQAVARTEWVQTAPDEFAKVGRVPAIKNEDGSYGSQIAYSDIIKRYESENGTLVDLSDDEIAECLDLPSGLAEIVAFQPVTLLNAGTYLPDSVMQVRGTRKGQQAQYALDLLFKSMRKRSVFALVRYVMRGTLHYGALMANGRFLTLRFDNEVRSALPLPTFENSEAELSQAVALIDSRTVAERIELTNNASERVREYAEAKAASMTASNTQTLVSHPVHATPARAVSTLLETLEASMEAARG